MSELMDQPVERRQRTIQDYIDESPVWPDGTVCTNLQMTQMQWRIWGLAIAGKFFEGLVVLGLTGLALPLLSHDLGLQTWQKSMVSSATLFGILIGATALGHLADHFGRRAMFIAEMALFTLFLVALTFAQDFAWLIICLFGVGVALGCDYPTAHLVISESVPSRGRGGLVLAAFAFQAVGAVAGIGLGYAILTIHPALDAWRWMFAVPILPAIGVVVARFYICDSAHWLVSRGRVADAEAAAYRLLRREPQYPRVIELHDPHLDPQGVRQAPKRHLLVLFNKQNIRATMLASVPWFLQDLSTYGIGIFTPVILEAAFGMSAPAHHMAVLVHKVQLAALGTLMLDFLLLAGIIAAILLVERAGRIKLQIIGFIGCAAGLALATLSMQGGGNNLPLLFTGFMLFNFMTNIGPNAQTYLLAGEVFPTAIRGYGAGFAASVAKVGAVLTALGFPLLLKSIGTPALLVMLIIASLLGAVATWAFRMETRGELRTIAPPA